MLSNEKKRKHHQKAPDEMEKAFMSRVLSDMLRFCLKPHCIARGTEGKSIVMKINISQSLTESMYIFVMYLFVELSLAIKVLSSFVEINCLQ